VPRSGADIESRTRMGVTLIIYAADAENGTQIVHLLLKYGADVNAVMYDGRSALWLAARRGSKVELVKILLAAGASPVMEFNAARETAIATEGN
jgi:ankyrin repeat protein